MTSDDDPDLAALEKLSGELSAALRSIADDQWSLATPCPDWDLSALVDHMTGGNWFTRWIFDGLSADEAMTRTVEQFSGGGASAVQATSSVADQLTVFTRPGVLDRTWSHVVGDLTGRQILRLRLQDLIVHTWDVGETVDAPAGLHADLVNWGMSELADEASLTAKHFQLVSIRTFETGQNTATTYLRRFGR